MISANAELLVDANKTSRTPTPLLPIYGADDRELIHGLDIPSPTKHTPTPSKLCTPPNKPSLKRRATLSTNQDTNLSPLVKRLKRSSVEPTGGGNESDNEPPPSPFLKHKVPKRSRFADFFEERASSAPPQSTSAPAPPSDPEKTGKNVRIQLESWHTPLVRDPYPIGVLIRPQSRDPEEDQTTTSRWYIPPTEGTYQNHSWARWGIDKFERRADRIDAEGSEASSDSSIDYSGMEEPSWLEELEKTVASPEGEMDDGSKENVAPVLPPEEGEIRQRDDNVVEDGEEDMGQAFDSEEESGSSSSSSSSTDTMSWVEEERKKWDRPDAFGPL